MKLTCAYPAASSWNGFDQGAGAVSLHSWNDGAGDEGEPTMGQVYNERMVPRTLQAAAAAAESARRNNSWW